MSAMPSIPTLDTKSILPPLLACLPTAFASPKPPPALLPLLSPILSQRVQLLSESTEKRTWLPLLNWDTQEASQLESIIEDADLEPHPISGEIEIGDAEATRYRRIDEETLQALANLPEAGLAIVYVWCTGTDGTEAWRVAEVKPVHGSWTRNPTPWEASIYAAGDAFESKTHAPAVLRPAEASQPQEEEEDDGDYWALYDNTPGRTPARTPAAQGGNTAEMAMREGRQHSQAVDDSYWSQYADVQPAMDGEDPDERAAHRDTLGSSGLDGNVVLQQASRQRSLFTPGGSKNETDATRPEDTTAPRSLYTPNGTAIAAGGVNNGSFTMFPPTAPESRQQYSPTREEASYEHIQHPRPQSAHSSGSRASSQLIEQLEEQAERSSNRGASSSVADIAIQQHISTSLKSLYRLSKGAGMDRKEFERIINAELDVLGMMDDD